MKAFLRPYLNSIETFEDLVLYEKNNLWLMSFIYYFVSVLMLFVAFQLFPNKFLIFLKSILGVIYIANVIGFGVGATLARQFSLRVSEVKTYPSLVEFKKKFYLALYLSAGIPFMALIAWAVVYADLRFAFEMILAFVATVGAIYFGDWKSFKSYNF